MQVLTRLIHSLYNHKNRSNATPATEDCQLTPEEAINLLSAARRRYIIAYLSQVDEEIPIRELTEAISKMEDSDRKNVYITCHQNHFNKLEKCGAVERRGDLVAPGPTCEALARIQQRIQYELD